MKIGETRHFTVEVPADFPVDGMPGKSIDYEVTLKGIKHKVLPALDDAFASGVSSGKTLDELRKLTRDALESKRKQESEGAKRNDILRQLLAAVECELPQDLVRSQTRTALSEIVRENQERGVSEDVLRENEKELLGVAAASARERLKTGFVLMRIAEAEGITVRREELMGRVAALAQRYELTYEKMLKELERREGLSQINEQILTAKVLDFLSANASVTTVPVALSAPPVETTL